MAPGRDAGDDDQAAVASAGSVSASLGAQMIVGFDVGPPSGDGFRCADDEATRRAVDLGGVARPVELIRLKRRPTAPTPVLALATQTNGRLSGRRATR